MNYLKSTLTSFFKLSLFSMFIMLPLISSAQPDPEGDPDAPQTPIDGGISLLIAAGVAYGTKKLYDVKNKKNSEQEK